AGCTISLAGTATDTTGVFTAKMANSAGADTSTLELKDDSASLKAAKGASDSSLSLASTKATLASKEVKLELDGEGKGATLTAGSHKVDVNDQNGWAFTSKKDFAIDASADVKIDGQNVSLIKGKFKFSEAAFSAKTSGTLTLESGMIKIG
ncbi:MAG: hypothetical protein J5863_05345, partial [Desulfovibrio sp.]|nr:hypothetical protein [Desulfovibrio sp.]